MDSLLDQSDMFQDTTALARNIHSQIAERIGLAILRGEFLPGSRLPPEQRICVSMGVGRPAVREAMRLLEAKGLIEARPKSGTKVRELQHWNHLDPDMLRWRLATTDVDGYLLKLMELRQVLDPAASAMAAKNAGAEDRRRLKAAFEAMRGAASDGDFVEADIGFHKAIYIATGNEFFWPLAQLFELALRPGFRIAAGGSHRDRALEKHGLLMTAILAGDAAKASRYAMELLGQSRRDLEAIRDGQVAPAPGEGVA